MSRGKVNDTTQGQMAAGGGEGTEEDVLATARRWRKAVTNGQRDLGLRDRAGRSVEGGCGIVQAGIPLERHPRLSDAPRNHVPLDGPLGF